MSAAPVDGFYSMNPSMAFEYHHVDIMRIAHTLIVTNARCKFAVGRFDAGTLFPRVEYKLQSRQIWVLCDGAMEPLHLIFKHHDLHVTHRQLETEVLSLMLRGHSLHAHACGCSCSMGTARMLDLGIVPSQGVECAARYVSRFTSQEIQRELGISDLDAVYIGKNTIAELLLMGVFFERVGREWQLSDACRVLDRQSLRIYLQLSPYGVDAATESIQYSGLRNDIDSMLLDGDILWLCPGSGTSAPVLSGRLYLSRMAGGKCDADVAAMWHAAGRDI